MATRSTTDERPVLGIDIGGTSVKVAVVSGSLLQATAASDPYAMPDECTLREALAQAMARLGDVNTGLAGVCAPGLLDPVSQRITLAVNAPGLVGMDLAAAVRSVASSVESVFVCPDARAAALGHWVRDQHPGRTLSLALGTGVGGCVLDADAPVEMTGSSCGHIGQIDVGSMDDHPPPSSDASRGTLESYIGVRALIDRYGGDGVGGWLDAPLTDPAWRALIGAIRTCHAIYRPDRVVLLGGVGQRLAPSVPRLRAAVNSGITSVVRSGWKLETGSADSGVIGAAHWASRRSQAAVAARPSVSRRPDDSVHGQLGRLIWVGVRGAVPGDPWLEADLDCCERAQVGGVILFDVDVPERDRLIRSGLVPGQASIGAPRNMGPPEQTRELISYLRQRLGDQIVVCIDQEGGRVSRLEARHGYPQLPAAAVFSGLAAPQRAQACAQVASVLASLGVDLNLAPCVDLQRGDGPITSAGRSFGDDAEVVAAMAVEQIRFMREAGVASCIKHFPGHGSASADTHDGLVDITRSWSREAELAPFRGLLESTEPPLAVMVGHLVHRQLDPALPASLSPGAISRLLRDELGWQGLVITDSLDMRAITDQWPAGEAAVLALLAGADVVLDGNNLYPARPCPAMEIHDALRRAHESGRLTSERIARSVHRLSALRCWPRRGVHA